MYMRARIISKFGKNEDKGAGPDFRVEYLKTQILLKATTTNIKSLRVSCILEITFCGTPKLWGPWNLLFPLYLPCQDG